MIDFSQITACLITRELEYPPEVLAPIASAGFSRILIYTNCPSMDGRGVILAQASTPWMFTCDDDVIPALDALKENGDLSFSISAVMSPDHIAAYKDRLACLFNWGALISKPALDRVNFYTERYGKDFIFHREYDRILSAMNYPQHRIEAKCVDLPRSAEPFRISSDPLHFTYLDASEARCRAILGV